jgi:hypothetical protein
MNTETILSKAALLWWESLDDYKKQAILLNNNFTGVLVTDEWKVKCYNAEHPTTPIADLTGNKIFDTPLSMFLRQENDVLKERIKSLMIDVVKHFGESSITSFHLKNKFVKDTESTLEQTK